MISYFHYLGYLRLLARGRATKFVKFDVKPAVDVSMDDMILVANLLTGETLFHGLETQPTTELISTTL